MRIPVLTLGLVTILACGQVFLLPQQSTLWLDSARPLELWRWVTAHWLHTDLSHALWNGFALLVLGSWVEQFSRTNLILSLLYGMIAVTVWFYVFENDSLYVGLSGALHTLLIVGLGYGLQDAQHRSDQPAVIVIWIAAFVVVTKVVTEHLFAWRWFEIGTWPAATGAHLTGACTGLVGWVMVGRHLPSQADNS